MKVSGRFIGCALVGLALCAGATAVRAQDAHHPGTPAGHTEAPGHGGKEKANPLLDEGKNVPSYLFTVLVFVLLVVVLRFTAWKPILAALKSRELSIREALEAAARAKEEAAKTAQELEARIAEAQRAGAQALAQAKQDATKLAATIKAQAESDAAALKDRTLRDIEAAKQQAVSDINAHAAELGTAIARKILKRNVTAEDQDRLVSESLAQLRASREN